MGYRGGNGNISERDAGAGGIAIFQRGMRVRGLGGGVNISYGGCGGEYNRRIRGVLRHYASPIREIGFGSFVRASGRAKLCERWKHNFLNASESCIRCSSFSFFSSFPRMELAFLHGCYQIVIMMVVICMS